MQDEKEYLASITLPERIPANFHWVTDDLATGGDLHWQVGHAEQQIEELVEAGITHIIDMRMEWTDEVLVSECAPHIKYLHLRTNDAHGYRMPADVFDNGVAFARQAQAEGGKVLAHCHMGINRGPSMAMAILLDRGYQPREAFDLIRTQRDIAAIGYARDAVIAHTLRDEGMTDDDAYDFVQEFIAYENSVWTPEENQRINRIIRGIRAQEGGTILNTQLAIPTDEAG